MEKKRFKTNAACSGCVAHIATKLNAVIAPEQWSIDLGSPDRVLTVTGDVPDDRVMEAVRSAGYEISRLD